MMTITNAERRPLEGRPGWSVSSLVMFEPTVTVSELIDYHENRVEILMLELGKYRFKNGNLKAKGKPIMEELIFHRRAAATLQALPESMNNPLSPISMARSTKPVVKAEPLRNEHGH